MESLTNISEFTIDVLANPSWNVYLSDDNRYIFELTNSITASGLIAVFGILANIINIIVFYKQGFSTTANIAFFGLAISDLCCLVSEGWISISQIPLPPISRLPWVAVDIVYLTAAWPHICFCRITSYITVYITAERYLSIAFPLKIKQMVTARRTTVIICLIYVVNLFSLIPEYTTLYLGWKYFPKSNKTLISLLQKSNRADVGGIAFVFHSLLSMASFVGVIIFTIILVIKLRQSSKTRKEIISGNNDSGNISDRDKKTVKMIVLIASVLIACYTPGAIIALATFIVGPEFDFGGKYNNILVAGWSFCVVFQTLNSSINIFVYYNMSSKYRQHFKRFLKRNSIQQYINRCG